MHICLRLCISLIIVRPSKIRNVNFRRIKKIKVFLYNFPLHRIGCVLTKHCVYCKALASIVKYSKALCRVMEYSRKIQIGKSVMKQYTCKWYQQQGRNGEDMFGFFPPKKVDILTVENCFNKSQKLRFDKIQE